MARASNQRVLTRGDRAFAKKKSASRVESVSYDPEARKEFLTGFHKRKLQRQEDGRKKAEEREKLALQLERKKIRAEKTKSIEQSMQRLREAEDIIAGRNAGVDAEDETNNAPEQNDDKSLQEDDDETKPKGSDTDDGEEEFSGFSDSSGILKKKISSQKHSTGSEDDDETTVTVEEMQLDPYVDMSRAQAVLKSSTERAHAYAKYVNSLHRGPNYGGDDENSEEEEEPEVQKPKAKRKKFRYLPKQERKAISKIQRRQRR